MLNINTKFHCILLKIQWKVIHLSNIIETQGIETQGIETTRYRNPTYRNR